MTYTAMRVGHETRKVMNCEQLLVSVLNPFTNQPLKRERRKRKPSRERFEAVRAV